MTSHHRRRTRIRALPSIGDIAEERGGPWLYLGVLWYRVWRPWGTWRPGRVWCSWCWRWVDLPHPSHVSIVVNTDALMDGLAKAQASFC
jgi:hypothetical protein